MLSKTDAELSVIRCGVSTVKTSYIFGFATLVRLLFFLALLQDQISAREALRPTLYRQNIKE